MTAPPGGFAIVAHADWSASPAKRWIAAARWDGARHVVDAPGPVVGPAAGLVRALLAEGPALLGLDAVVGVPAAYGRKVEAATGVRDFPAYLTGPALDHAATLWSVAEEPGDVGLWRPFYPRRPGGRRRQHLADGLGIPLGQLRRRCDDAAGGETPFWTLGGRQVGKATLAAWAEVLVPLLRDGAVGVGLWPFHGALDAGTGRVVVAEAYPGAAARRLLRRGPASKRRAADRAAWFSTLPRDGWAATPALEAAAADGFGTDATGEDRFDAVVGVLGLVTALRSGTAGPPGDLTDEVRRWEGWIAGVTG